MSALFGGTGSKKTILNCSARPSTDREGIAASVEFRGFALRHSAVKMDAMGEGCRACCGTRRCCTLCQGGYVIGADDIIRRGVSTKELKYQVKHRRAQLRCTDPTNKAHW